MATQRSPSNPTTRPPRPSLAAWRPPLGWCPAVGHPWPCLGRLGRRCWGRGTGRRLGQGRAPGPATQGTCTWCRWGETWWRSCRRRRVGVRAVQTGVYVNVRARDCAAMGCVSDVGASCSPQRATFHLLVCRRNSLSIAGPHLQQSPLVQFDAPGKTALTLCAPSAESGRDSITACADVYRPRFIVSAAGEPQQDVHLHRVARSGGHLHGPLQQRGPPPVHQHGGGQAGAALPPGAPAVRGAHGGKRWVQQDAVQ